MAVATDTKVHSWIKHIVVPVQVVPDFEDDNAVMAVNTEEELARAIEDAVYGCSECGALLTYDTSTTDCPGKDNHA